MVRYKRMKGFDALWVPGTDHAGIATQMVVEKLLASEGTSRRALGRDAFLGRVWAWKEQYGSRIVTQIKRLGASCDWGRERFTLDDGLSSAARPRTPPPPISPAPSPSLPSRPHLPTRPPTHQPAHPPSPLPPLHSSRTGCRGVRDAPRARPRLPGHLHGELGAAPADGRVGPRGGVLGGARDALPLQVPPRRRGGGGVPAGGDDAAGDDPGGHGGGRAPGGPEARRVAAPAERKGTTPCGFGRRAWRCRGWVSGGSAGGCLERASSPHLPPTRAAAPRCRYAKFVGKQVVVPMSGGRTIPVIADEYVDREFGTGALKARPAACSPPPPKTTPLLALCARNAPHTATPLRSPRPRRRSPRGTTPTTTPSGSAGASRS